MIKKNILILEGGFNEEHEVSLKTSLEIQKILNELNFKYKVLMVNPKNFEKKISNFKNYICFNALHGPYGEDGQIQKILKKNNIKFTHSNIKSSRICFDKIETKKIIAKNNILTPRYKIFDIKDLNNKNLLKLKKIFKQFVVKPSKSGSSYAIKIIKNNSDLSKFISELENYKEKITKNNKIILEEFISGKELTVSTINFTKKIKALAVTEIISKNHFFDYQAKYSKGYSSHILPANINLAKYERCLNLARKIHKLLKCKSIARTDFILNKKNGKIYFLETNTQPGLTSVSLFPEQAKFKNISFQEVVLGIFKNTN